MFNLAGKALTTLAIPAEIDGFPVTRIESLSGNFGSGSTSDIVVKRIVIPEGVKSIGNLLPGWQSYEGIVEIPSSVQEIDNLSGYSFPGSFKVVIKKGSPLKEEFDSSTGDNIWGAKKSNITFEE